MFSPDEAGDLRLVVNLRLPDGDFAVQVVDEQLLVEARRNAAPDCVVAGDQNALRPVLYAGKPVEAAVAEESLRIEGNAGVLTRLAGTFRKPEPMMTPAEP